MTTSTTRARSERWMPFASATLALTLMPAVSALAEVPRSPVSLQLQLGHGGSVMSLAISPDDKLVATGGSEGTTLVWQAPRPLPARQVDYEALGWRAPVAQQLRAIPGHSDWVGAVAFSPDGRRIATGGSDGFARVVDIATGQEVFRVGGYRAVTAVDFSPDGTQLLTLGEAQAAEEKTGEPRLWDSATGREIRLLGKDCLAGAFSPDGSTIAVGCNDGAIQLYDRSAPDAPPRRIAAHPDPIGTLAFSEDGEVLLSAPYYLSATDEPQTVRLWNPRTGDALGRLDEELDVYGAALSPDGRLAAVNASGMVHLREALTGKDVGAQPYFGCPGGSEATDVTAVRFSRDGTNLVLGCNIGITVFEELGNHSGLERPALMGYAGPVNALAVAADPASPSRAPIIATGSDGTFTGDTALRVWSVDAGREIERLAADPGATAATFLGGGSRIALAAGRNVEIRDRGRAVRAAPELQLEAPFTVRQLAASRDGKILAAAAVSVLHPNGASSDDTDRAFQALIWDAASGRRLHVVFDQGDVTAIAVAPDGSRVAVARQFGQIEVVRVRDGKDLRPAGLDDEIWDRGLRLTTVTSIAFSPDGKLLAVAYGDTERESHPILLQETDSGKVTGVLERHRRPIWSLQFSPDGELLASASEDGTVQFWDVASGNAGLALQHGTAVSAVAFVPDGSQVVTAAADGITRIWARDGGKEMLRLASFRDGRWVVVDPEGRFDTNELETVRGLSFVVADDPLRPLRIETFMRDYYEPGLLARVLTGERFAPLRPLATLNVAQPRVRVTRIRPGSEPDTVAVTVRVSRGRTRVTRSGRRITQESDPFDVQLFRDGQLVAASPASTGRIELPPGRRGTSIVFDNVRIPRRAGQERVEFSAHAFNIDRVKSAMHSRTWQRRAPAESARGRAFVLAVGVNAYQNPAWDLSYAADDARILASALTSSLLATNAYADVVPIVLLSDHEGKGSSRGVTVADATKARVKSVLDVLSGRTPAGTIPEDLRSIENSNRLAVAHPEDVLIIAWSGHGYASIDGKFFLLPYDSGATTGEELTDDVLRRAVSSDDLSSWLRDVDAGELALVVDACNSAAAIESGEFKPGPMGSRGFGQLAYDKRMRVLTATQADNIALETGERIRQGLLTYALVVDGLESGRADAVPADGTIRLGEWLGYGEARVPLLWAEVKSGKHKRLSHPKPARATEEATAPSHGGSPEAAQSRPPAPVVQRPALFDFTRGRDDAVLAERSR